MNSIPEEQDVEMVALIEKLIPVPGRSPRAAADGRANFLAEAQLLQPAVSRVPDRRRIEWKSIFSRKAPLKMSTIATLAVIFTMLFGGTGATVYAAQGSLPDQALYGVKLATEDVRLGMTTNNQSRMNLMMQYADLRLQEALQLAVVGKSVPSTVWGRMDGQYASTMQMAATLNDDQLRQQLPRMHDWMSNNLAKLTQLSNDPRYRGDCSRVQANFQNYLQLMSGGMTDPSSFRQYMGMHQYPGGWQNPGGWQTPYGWQTPASTGAVTPAPTSGRNMYSTPGSATRWPNNNNWNNQQQNRNRNDCCQSGDCCGQHHNGGGWGGWGR